MTGERTQQNKELLAQGVANGAVALLGGIPGAMATIRSVLVIKEGGTQRMVGVFTCLSLVQPLQLCCGISIWPWEFLRRCFIWSTKYCAETIRSTISNRTQDMELGMKTKRLIKIGVGLVFFVLMACGKEKETALDLVETEIEVEADVDEVESGEAISESVETPAVGSDGTAEQTDAETLQEDTGSSDSGTAGATSQDGASGAAESIRADVTAVVVTGAAGAYTFSVTVSSPDTGCEQYADWWEVLDEAGALLYRRVLLHSHIDEQPFARSGGPVAINAEQIVWVRAHMNATGYGGTTFKGSVQNGFKAAELAADFAADVESQAPLPQGCAF